MDESLRSKLATSRFKLDKVYSRKRIVANSAKFAETGDRAIALVKAHDERFADVVFEFARIGNGSKWKCFGVGRADRFPAITH